MSNGITFNNGPASARLSPLSLSFNAQTVGTTSSAANVTFSNSGSSPTYLYSITTAGAFAQTNNCPASLASGSSCTVRVTFSPTAAGAQTGTLSISDSAGSVPQVTALSGTGVVPGISFAPAALTFSSQEVGSTSNPQTITLTNSGLGLLMISGVSVSANFQLTGNSCSGTVAAAASCSFSVVFAPAASGLQSGVITVQSNASDANTASLSGSGADFGVSATPNTQSVAAGTPATYTISVPSQGAAFSGTITLTCVGLPADSTCKFAPASVNADASSTLTIVTQASRMAAFTRAESQRNATALALWLPFSGAGLLGFLFIKPRKRPAERKATVVAVVSTLAILLIVFCQFGCAGISTPASTIPGTASGTYNVVVTGSSGSLQHNTTLTLTVR